MKNRIKIMALMLIWSVGSVATLAYAKPERVQIKKTENRAQETSAKRELRNIDFQKIEDPEARRAIRGIMNYLNISASAGQNTSSIRTNEL